MLALTDSVRIELRFFRHTLVFENCLVCVWEDPPAPPKTCIGIRSGNLKGVTLLCILVLLHMRKQALNWRQSRRPPSGECINPMWSLRTLWYSSGIKGWSTDTCHLNLKNTMRREASHGGASTVWLTYVTVQNRWSYQDRELISSPLGLGQKEWLAVNGSRKLWAWWKWFKTGSWRWLHNQ